MIATTVAVSQLYCVATQYPALQVTRITQTIAVHFAVNVQLHTTVPGWMKIPGYSTRHSRSAPGVEQGAHRRSEASFETKTLLGNQGAT
nr:hypothetical protein [Ruegeria atlantica]